MSAARGTRRAEEKRKRRKARQVRRDERTLVWITSAGRAALARWREEEGGSDGRG
jgi:hypothetical protein